MKYQKILLLACSTLLLSGCESKEANNNVASDVSSQKSEETKEEMIDRFRSYLTNIRNTRSCIIESKSEYSLLDSNKQPVADNFVDMIYTYEVFEFKSRLRMYRYGDGESTPKYMNDRYYEYNYQNGTQTETLLDPNGVFHPSDTPPYNPDITEIASSELSYYNPTNYHSAAWGIINFEGGSLYGLFQTLYNEGSSSITHVNNKYTFVFKNFDYYVTQNGEKTTYSINSMKFAMKVDEGGQKFVLSFQSRNAYEGNTTQVVDYTATISQLGSVEDFVIPS